MKNSSKLFLIAIMVIVLSLILAVGTLRAQCNADLRYEIVVGSGTELQVDFYLRPSATPLAPLTLFHFSIHDAGVVDATLTLAGNVIKGTSDFSEYSVEVEFNYDGGGCGGYNVLIARFIVALDGQGTIDVWDPTPNPGSASNPNPCPE